MRQLAKVTAAVIGVGLGTAACERFDVDVSPLNGESISTHFPMRSFPRTEDGKIDETRLKPLSEAEGPTFSALVLALDGLEKFKYFHEPAHSEGRNLIEVAHGQLIPLAATRPDLESCTNALVALRWSEQEFRSDAGELDAVKAVLSDALGRVSIESSN